MLDAWTRSTCCDAQAAADRRKYNDLALVGLTVVRFAWEHVTIERAYTRTVLHTCVDGTRPWLGASATGPHEAA